jgi:hypothetical protein
MSVPAVDFVLGLDARDDRHATVAEYSVRTRKLHFTHFVASVTLPDGDANPFRTSAAGNDIKINSGDVVDHDKIRIHLEERLAHGNRFVATDKFWHPVLTARLAQSFPGKVGSFGVRTSPELCLMGSIFLFHFSLSRQCPVVSQSLRNHFRCDEEGLKVIGKLGVEHTPVFAALRALECWHQLHGESEQTKVSENEIAIKKAASDSTEHLEKLARDSDRAPSLKSVEDSEPSVFERVCDSLTASEESDPLMQRNEARYDRRWALSMAVDHHKMRHGDAANVLKTAEAFMAFLSPEQSPSEDPPTCLSESKVTD